MVQYLHSLHDQDALKFGWWKHWQQQDSESSQPFHLSGCSLIFVYERDKSIVPKTASKCSSHPLPRHYCTSTEWEEYYLHMKGFAKRYHPSLCVQSVPYEAIVSVSREPPSLGSHSAAISNVNKMLPATSPTRCPRNTVNK